MTYNYYRNQYSCFAAFISLSFSSSIKFGSAPEDTHISEKLKVNGFLNILLMHLPLRQLPIICLPIWFQNSRPKQLRQHLSSIILPPLRNTIPRPQHPTSLGAQSARKDLLAPCRILTIVLPLSLIAYEVHLAVYSLFQPYRQRFSFYHL